MTRGETIREDYRPSQASAKVRFTLTGDGDLFPEMLESSEEEDQEIRDAKSITKKGFQIDFSNIFHRISERNFILTILACFKG